MSSGLVGGEGFAVDASVIEVNASRYQRIEGSEVDWMDQQRARRPVREYLAALESENPPVNPDQKPKAMSPSDPCAAWKTRGGTIWRHMAMFGYSLNYPDRHGTRGHRRAGIRASPGPVGRRSGGRSLSSRRSGRP